MHYALHSATEGTFIGLGFGLVFFSKTDTAGQHTAATCGSVEEAQALIAHLADAAPADIRIEEVRSGHWTDLAAAGLHTGDMAANVLLYSDAAGSA